MSYKTYWSGDSWDSPKDFDKIKFQLPGRGAPEWQEGISSSSTVPQNTP